MINSQLVLQIPQCLVTTLTQWLLHARSLALLSTLRRSHSLLPWLSQNWYLFDETANMFGFRMTQGHHSWTWGHFQGKVSHQANYPIPSWKTSFSLPCLQARQGLSLHIDRDIHESYISAPQDQSKWQILWGHHLVAPILTPCNGTFLLCITQWVTSEECELFSGASNLGYHCYFQGHWCPGMFWKVNLKAKLMSINWRELYAVTMAIAMWGSQYHGKKDYGTLQQLLCHADYG